MRDLLVTLTIVGSLPFILARPHFGVLMWIWVSVMNPHRLTWGFAYDFPFGQLIAVATLFGLLFRARAIRIPWSAPTVLLMLFVLWMNFTTLFALAPQEAHTQWVKVMKIMFMTFIMLIAIDEQRQIKWLVWTLVLSLAFYGVKGGVFTLLGGGADRVFGPPGSDIEDNNDLALALLMTIPLLWYVRSGFTKRWIRLGFLGTIGLCALAALGTYSRGALITASCMTAFVLLKSKSKIRFALLLLILMPLALGFMPEQWLERMGTITAYGDDKSSLGRLNAWHMTFNLALDRPFVGGGFQLYQPHVYERYAPDPTMVLAAHSIYFSAMGEHGFIGFALFLLLILASWRTATWIMRRSDGQADLRWAADLAMVIQVSLVGYMVGGAFLSMLYFDLPYYLVGVLVLVRKLVEKAQAKLHVVATVLPSDESQQRSA
jgi:probable O-glycosylation ligase (exosortase A-associated)